MPERRRRRAPRVLRSALAVTLVICAVSGCSSTADKNAPAPKPGFNPAAPFTSYPSTNPGNTVLSFWRLLQIGAYNGAIRGYDPSVVDAVGATDFLQVLADQRSGVALLKPSLTASHKVPGGVIMVVSAVNSHDERGTYSFELRNIHTRWFIVYDSLIGESLVQTLQNSSQQSSTGGTKPGDAARRAAIRAARKYRRAAYDALSNGVKAP